MSLHILVRKSKTFFKAFFKRFNESEVVNNSVVLAYYLLLSLFPLVMVLGSVLPLLNVHVQTVLEYLETAVPGTIYNMTEPIVRDFLKSGSGEVLSFGAILTLYSASQAVAAFQRTVNRAYNVAKYQNPIINRLFGFIITVIIIMVMATFVFAFSFGQTLISYLTPILNLPTSLLDTVGKVKWPVTFAGIFISLAVLYYLAPNAKVKFRFVMPGTLVATLGSMLLSQFFSYYLRYFSRSVTSYKTLGTFIAIMFWLNFSAMIIMVGAVINATCQELRAGEIEEASGSIKQVVRKYRIRK